MIRVLTERDYHSVKLIYMGAFDVSEHPMTDLHDSWAIRSEENSYGIFGLEGMIGFAICSFTPHKSNMYLDYIAIDQCFRGLGYGSVLLNYLIQKCKSEHRSLHLFPDSFELTNWYKKIRVL